MINHLPHPPPSPPLPSPPSVTVCTFASRSDVEWYVVVGTARDLTLNPRTCSGGSLILFKLTPDGAKLEHVHTVSEPGHLAWLCVEVLQ